MKNYLKTSIALGVIALACMGSYKAYGTYITQTNSEEDLLLTENVLAVSESWVKKWWDSKDYSYQKAKKTVAVLAGSSVPDYYEFKSVVVIAEVIVEVIYEVPCNKCIDGSKYAHCSDVPQVQCQKY